MGHRKHTSQWTKSENLRSQLNSTAKKPAGRVSTRNETKGLPSDPVSFRLMKPTFGENLSGLQIEAVTDLLAPGHLALLVRDSKSLECRGFVEHRNVTYVPGVISPGLGRIVRIPAMTFFPGSPDELQSEIKELFSTYLDQEKTTIELLVAFVFASWFIHFFQVAPVLWLSGPDYEVGVALRLLNILSYHSLLLSDVDIAALRTLPTGLRVTLLVNQTNLVPGVERALSNSVRREFCFARGAHPIDMFGARALHCHCPSQNIGLSASIDPARRHLPCLTEKNEEEASSYFQARLLAYRMTCYEDVQKFEVDYREGNLGIEQEMRTWLAAVPRGSDLKNSITRAFAERREESMSARFDDPRCLVAEAALMFCHRTSTKYFYVGELAEKVNDLSLGRHTDVKLEDRKVGSLLKNLGIHATRVTKGFRVTLTPQVRQRIHSVATAYRVLSTEPKVTRCADCKKDQ